MINTERTLQIFNDHCVVNGRSMILYGQYHPEHINRRQAGQISLCDDDGKIAGQSICFPGKKRDFCLSIPCTDDCERKTYRLVMGRDTALSGVSLRSPFVGGDGAGRGMMMVTMVRNYANRIAEWIHYHLHLGAAKIVVFCNNCTDDTQAVIDNLNDKRVVAVPFDYTCFDGFIYDEIQRMAMSIGSLAFKKDYGWTCLVDADEFIYLPTMTTMDIGAFLNQKKYRNARAVTMQSIVLTNKNAEDVIDNNIIDLCRFSDVKPLYTKTILNNRKTAGRYVIKSPHRWLWHRVLPVEAMYHCHCWCNERLTCQPHFVERSELLRFKNSYSAHSPGPSVSD